MAITPDIYQNNGIIYSEMKIIANYTDLWESRKFKHTAVITQCMSLVAAS